MPDPSLLQFILVALVVAVTHYIGAVGGFGSALLALPMLVLVLGSDALPTAVAMLLVLGIGQAAQITCYTYRDIDRGELKRILLWAAPALPAGALAVSHLPREPVMLGLGVVLLAGGGLAIAELRPATWRAWGVLGPLLMLLFGLIHGAYGTGGIALTLYAQHALPRQEPFRATLSVLWVITNVPLLLYLLATSTFSGGMWALVMVSLPLVFAAAWLGQRTAQRLPHAHFARLVAWLLVLTGVVTVARAALR